MEGSTQVPCTRLSACALGGALGIFGVIAVVVLGVLAHLFKYGAAWVGMVSSIYIGFAATPKGILIGVVWAFFDGLICGAIIAWLYNFIAKRCPCKNCSKANAA